MFHGMRNRAIDGTDIPAGTLDVLSRRLPPSWRIAGSGPGGAITLRAPDGSTGRMTVVNRRRLDPRDVLAMERLAGRNLDGQLVVAPFLSARARELLRDAGASYADATGNVRIALPKPGLFIEAEGARKDPTREKRPLASLKGPAAGRVIRALCDVRPPYGVRRLSDIAQTPPASVSRVIALLQREALVDRDERGRVSAVDWAKLLQRWAQDYQVLSSNEPASFLDPRGVSAFLQRVPTYKRPIAVTGSLAALRRAPVAPPRMAMAYVEDPAAAAKALALRPADAGANVMLLRPFDPVVFARSWTEEGVSFAALSQVAADLLSSPGRGPAEGEELIAWMGKHPDAWRA
jgi:hypothetical protein